MKLSQKEVDQLMDADSNVFQRYAYTVQDLSDNTDNLR